jgi:hypothetical protein
LKFPRLNWSLLTGKFNKVLKLMSLNRWIEVMVFLTFSPWIWGQEWASIKYWPKDDHSFIGQVMTDGEDIVKGSQCEKDRCLFEMTVEDYIAEMAFRGWEVSEQLESKDKKVGNVIWFRRY